MLPLEHSWILKGSKVQAQNTSRWIFWVPLWVFCLSAQGTWTEPTIFGLCVLSTNNCFESSAIVSKQTLKGIIWGNAKAWRWSSSSESCRHEDRRQDPGSWMSHDFRVVNMRCFSCQFFWFFFSLPVWALSCIFFSGLYFRCHRNKASYQRQGDKDKEDKQSSVGSVNVTHLAALPAFCRTDKQIFS